MADCGMPLVPELELVARRGMNLESESDAGSRQAAAAQFHAELAGMAPVERDQIWQRIRALKRCHGAPLSEQQTTIGRDGRKRVITDR